MTQARFAPPDQAHTRAVFDTDYEGNPTGRMLIKAENDPSTPFNVIYYGEAPPGTATSDAVWAIRKFTYDSNGSMTSMSWAGGRRSFINVWDDRASLSYT